MCAWRWAGPVDVVNPWRAYIQRKEESLIFGLLCARLSEGRSLRDLGGCGREREGLEKAASTLAPSEAIATTTREGWQEGA
jgi:hypothetical protein